MPEVAFALLIGFILGILVGLLMRSEHRQFEAAFGSQDEAEH